MEVLSRASQLGIYTPKGLLEESPKQRETKIPGTCRKCLEPVFLLSGVELVLDYNPCFPKFISPEISMSQVQQYWLPGYGLSRHIVLGHIHYFLGPSASVRPYSYQVRRAIKLPRTAVTLSNHSLLF